MKNLKNDEIEKKLFQNKINKNQTNDKPNLMDKKILIIKRIKEKLKIIKIDIKIKLNQFLRDENEKKNIQNKIYSN
jgi:hypothetical protein